MRTTLDLDDGLHELARRRAFEERRSIGEVISELALLGVQASQRRPVRQLGLYAGRVHVADDFDETPPEVLDALDEPLR